MEVLVVWACLVVLCQFHGVLCDDNELLNRYFKHYERMKRCSESDSPKPKQSDERNNKAKSLSITGQLPANVVPKTVIRVHLPISESNEPKDINNILNDIATIAQHKNNTIGIQKIRNLVDEIAKHGDTTVKVNVRPLKKEPINTNVRTVLNYVDPMNHIQTKETISTVTSKSTQPTTKERLVTENAKTVLKHIDPMNHIETKESISSVTSKSSQPTTKEQLETDNAITVLKHVEPSNETTKKETVFHYITVPEPITADPIELTDLVKIGADKPAFPIERRSNSDLVDHGGKIRSILKDKNIVKLREHEYEEVLTRPPKEMNNLYNRQNYNYEYSNKDAYTGIGKYYGNYNTIGNNYPFLSYQNNIGSKEYYYDSDNENTNPSSQQILEENKDYARYRKTELDRDTVIRLNQNEELVKSINEDRKETMNIQSPYFCRKYYSVTQKRYSGDNGVIIQNEYYNQ